MAPITTFTPAKWPFRSRGQRCARRSHLLYCPIGAAEGGRIVPIPALTPDGYLPPGAHDCTLDDVEADFTGNPHRIRLMDELRRFLTWLDTVHGLALPYYVDGSYTTSKTTPSDIDFIIDITHATQVEIGKALYLFSMEKDQIKTDFHIDFWLYHPVAGNDLRAFFQYVRTEELNQRKLPIDTRKGILRIVP